MLPLASGEVNSLLQTVGSEKKIFRLVGAAFNTDLRTGDENVARICCSDRGARIYDFFRRRAGKSGVISARKTRDGAHSRQILKQTAT
jgi:hypothetical protein